jgi:hypothetical protein
MWLGQKTAAPKPQTPTARRASAFPLTLPEQNNLQEVLHEPHWTERTKIILALADPDLSSQVPMARKLASCGTAIRFFLDETTRTVNPWIHRCRHRLCPFCAKFRAARVADQLEASMSAMTHPRLIVLTVKSTSGPLHEQLHDLRRWFAKLRRTKLWRSSVLRGDYTIEITINLETGLWHPHLNAVYDGKFIPHKQLQLAWHTITKNSQVVWISDVTDKPGAAYELSKYIGKPQTVSHLPPAKIREYAQAVHSVRMVQSFGKRAGVQVRDQDHKQTPAPRQSSISLPQLLWQANNGNQNALHLARLVAQTWPYLAPIVWHTFPQLSPERTQADKLACTYAIMHGGKVPRRQPPPKQGNPDIVKAQLWAGFALLQKQLTGEPHWQSSPEHG